MEYKVTTKTQLQAISGLLVSTVLFIIVIYFICLKDGFNTGILIVFTPLYLITFLPTLWLHLEYYNINKNDIIDIDRIQQSISFNSSRTISFNDIEKIKLYMPPVWHRKGTLKFLAFEPY